MPQTNYSIYQEVGFEGSLVHTAQPFCPIGTFAELVNRTGALLPYGRVVIANASNKSHVELPSATGQTPIGVTLASNTNEQESNEVGGFPDKNPVTVLAKGTIWMITEEAIADANIGANVFFRHTSGGGGTIIGRVRTDADTATADEWTSAKFASTASAGQLVAVEIM